MQVVEGVHILDCLDEVPGEVSRLRKSGVDVGYDIETTGLDPLHSKLVALQFKPKRKKATILDVRHFSPGDLRLLGSMLEPLFDGSLTLVGHNLKFDLAFALAQMGLAGHLVYDTMLAEQVIWGLGKSSGERRHIRFGMADLAGRYELTVHKEERSWFIDLDTRVEGAVLSQVGTRVECTDNLYEDAEGNLQPRQDCTDVPVMAEVGGYRPWNEPFPVEQVAYMRQDVSIVHKIKAAQQAAIASDHLEGVIALEMRALFALVGVEVFGVQINRDGWLSVISRVKSRADELETLLHLGREGEFEGLDIHVLKVRHEKYMEKWRPYSEWMKARDAFLATRKAEWDTVMADKPKGHAYVVPDGWVGSQEFRNWSEYKTWSLDWWYERHEKLSKPPASKAGVNLGSWMQVRDGFNDLGIPAASVSEDDLVPYLGRHPLVKVYIEYTHLRKVLTVYGTERGKKERSFIEMLDATDRLRASYQQIGADTGRMSSFSPNFQQIPADGVGAALRENVVAAPGHVLVVADFSNIELRIVAELSGDQFLLDAFASGQDVHAYTAKVMFGLSDEQATKEWTNSHNAIVGGREIQSTSYRKVAKTINYMLLYGAGVKKLAAELGATEKDAKALLKLYYQTFATAIGWLSEQKSRLDEARQSRDEQVYSETRSGRRRWFDIPAYPRHPANGRQVTVEAVQKWEADVEEWKSRMAGIKRQLANTPIQGLSADITKLAAALWYETVGYYEKARLVAIIHDEFIVEATPEEAEYAARILAQVMLLAMQTYLHTVDLGEVGPVQTPYWMH